MNRQANDRVAVVSFITSTCRLISPTTSLGSTGIGARHRRQPIRVEAIGLPSLRARLSQDVERSSNTIEKTFRALGDALDPLPGTKTIIVLGYAMGTWVVRFNTVYMANEYADAFAALQKARVSVFCIDLTRADYHPRQEGLQTIADDTGGFYMQSHIFSAAVFDRLAAALAGYYALLVVPPDVQKGERQIDVRLVHRKGTVFTKRRYVSQ